MLSKTTGRATADEAREPTLDVSMRARGRRWTWLGHILRLEDHRVIQQVLINRVEPTHDSLFGGVPSLEIAAGRENWKSLRPSKRYLIIGKCSKK